MRVDSEENTSLFPSTAHFGLSLHSVRRSVHRLRHAAGANYPSGQKQKVGCRPSVPSARERRVMRGAGLDIISSLRISLGAVRILLGPVPLRSLPGFSSPHWRGHPSQTLPHASSVALAHVVGGSGASLRKPPKRLAPSVHLWAFSAWLVGLAPWFLAYLSFELAFPRCLVG